MRIFELRKHPKLYKRAIKNVEEYSGDIDIERINNLSLDMAFNWSRTPEDSSFWSSVHSGDLVIAKSIHPHLFAPNKIQTKAGTMEVKNNGLWKGD